MATKEYERLCYKYNGLSWLDILNIEGMKAKGFIKTDELFKRN